MARLLEIIPAQSFEVIRDRIADILLEEIDNQVVLGGDYEIDASIFIERTIPFDKTELPAINVSLAVGDYPNKDVKVSDGVYTFNIDVFTSAKTTNEEQGDSRASIRLQKIIGKIRSILENPQFRTLGFAPPFIVGVGVQNFGIAQPGKQDAISEMMGRVIFNVNANEISELIVPRLITGYQTKIKMGSTEVGYYYTGIGG